MPYVPEMTQGVKANNTNYKRHHFTITLALKPGEDTIDIVCSS